MVSPADILRQVLVDLGHAADIGSAWPAYVSFLPDLPHEAVCVYDTAGRPDGRLMVGGTRIEHQGIQIRVRGLNYPTTWLKANQIALALDTMGQVLALVEDDGAYVIHDVSRTGAILPVGFDEQEKRRRYYFTINAVVTIPNLEDYSLRVTHEGYFRATASGAYRTLS